MLAKVLEQAFGLLAGLLAERLVVPSGRHVPPNQRDPHMPLSLTGAVHSAPLSPLIERWIADRRGLGYADTKRDESAVREMLASLGWTDLADLDPADMTTPGSIRLAGREKWHPRTRNKMQSHMSAFVRFLIDMGEVAGPNWVLTIPRAKDRNPGEGKTPLTPVQFWALHAKTIERGCPDDAAMFLALWRTAMPPSDWAALEVRHMTDPKKGGVPVLSVRRQKTTRARAIPLAPDVVEWFRAQARGKAPRDRLLPDLPDSKILKRHLAATGLDENEYGYTSFRKGFACDRALAGASLEVVQKAMAHGSSRTTTEHYQRFSGQQLAQGLGFARAPENSGARSLDMGGISPETNPVTSMNRNPRTIHDDSARASASGMDVTIQASGVEARADSPCVSGPGLESPAPTQSHLGDLNPRPVLYESTGPGISGDDESPTTRYLIESNQASALVVVARNEGAPRSVLAWLAGRAETLARAAALRLSRTPAPGGVV